MKPAKKILSLSLVLILFLHTNYLAVYYSLYKVNTDNLTASCCEKKVENCNAHCYLDRKMNEENDSNKKSTTTEMKMKITEYIMEDHFPGIDTDKILTYHTYKNFFRLKGYQTEVDHPPQS